MPFNTPNAATYDLLMNRRSVKARDMVGPGPDRADMEKILAAALRVPDHGKLFPWRYLVLEGAAREKLGDMIAKALIEENETSEKVAEKMKGYATQGPVLVVAISSVREESTIPVWEQELSAGAACQNMITAATALGYASCWLTGWASYSPTVKAGLGLKANENIAGFIFFGHQAEEPSERPRPEFDNHVTWGFPE
ncbi:nitroreductase [Kordiimonas sp.]|uniref:nitroreductase family protein n=1 Tax=Kordiimonas sp. TaxID=1970157 RepID=UPI003A8CA299